jgi:hypothetical protein
VIYPLREDFLDKLRGSARSAEEVQDRVG